MADRRNGWHTLFAPLVFTVTALFSGHSRAGDRISIPLPPQPPIPQIRLHAPPLMVWLPAPAVYVAMDSPYPIFCHEGRYYLRHGHAWYVGPGYAGPWAFMHVHLLPPGLRHYHDHDWGRYQHEARYWRRHEHHAHPHFYGHHRIDRDVSRAPVSYHDDKAAHHGHRDYHDRRRQTGYDPRARMHNRNDARHPAFVRADRHAGVRAPR